ncbi:MAG: pilus assembly protein [Mariniblastus sp.]|nr:pilus assembly protein [Mariniblastus sp.]MDG2183726.1 pilus assembly protein [Mariniblastus sp.]
MILKLIKRPRSGRTVGSNRHGAATVETAMLIPLLILVSLGATDVAQYINLAQSITNAARHGARFAAKDTTQTVEQVEREVERVFADLFPQCTADELESALVIGVTDLNGGVIGSGMLEDISSGNPVAVQVQFDFDAIRWLKGWEYFGFDFVRSEAIGRRE